MEKEVNWKETYTQWNSLEEEKRGEISKFLLKLSREEKRNLFRRELYAKRIYIEKLRCFDDENDLLIWQYINDYFGDKYPKVTAIAKTRLTPDIDLLKIEQLYGKEPFIVGYEVKLLGRKEIFNPFYAGLGEALCYFQYGVDQVWLLIGIPRNAPNDTENRIRKIWDFLKNSNNVPTYLGLRLLRERMSPIDINPEGKFYASSENAKYMRESLLKKQFSWAKRWLKDAFGE
jgi:hypothetical protein